MATELDRDTTGDARRWELQRVGAQGPIAGRPLGRDAPGSAGATRDPLTTGPLRVLIVEDSEDDALLLVRGLRLSGYDVTFKQVDTAATMEAAFREQEWDIVLSDYSMPGFAAPEALALLKQQNLDLPFIIISAAIGEDAAIAAMKAGAHDYVKKGNVARLIPAIERELREAEERRRRRAAEVELRQSETRYRTLVQTSPDAIMVTTVDGTITMANHPAAELYGCERPDELVGSNAFELIVPEDRSRIMDHVRSMVETGEVKRNVEYTLLKRNGTRFPASVSASLMVNEDGQPVAITSFIRDSTEQHRAREALEHQALHDPLTGLPNRTLLYDRLQQAVLAARRDKSSFALLLLDLDGFKQVNDTFGHHYGDLLLQRVGDRLGAVVRESDTIARLGGDEFALLLPTVDESDAGSVAGKIIGGLTQPFCVEGEHLEIGTSIGIALYPGHGTDATTLLQRADIAMYVAKRSRSGHATYSPVQEENNPSRLIVSGDLRRSMEEDQLVLHYQPKVDLLIGHTVGVEALVRWQHPKHGLVPPAHFIPIAEEAGMIKRLSLWVLRMALQQCRLWRESGLQLDVAINLSAQSLHDPQLVDATAELLHTWAVAPSWLTVEITESAIMLDPDRAMQTLAELHDMGILISIDDFGTGYSSLAYLKRLPVDEIKIDRSFVNDLARNQDDALIVRYIIDLGHHLGLNVVAEGVENQETVDRLAAMGCDLAQGFHLGRPLPEAECSRWLERQQTRSLLDRPAGSLG